MASDEFIKEERAWQREQEKRASEERHWKREARTERIQIISVCTAAFLSVAVIVWGVLSLVTHFSNRDTERINACSAAGGTWTSIGGGQGAPMVCVKMTVELPK